MANILGEFHSHYVPTKPSERSIVLPDGSTKSVDTTQFFSILFGGDQLTVARARGTAALRASHDGLVDRLEGIMPVVEDWHARLTLMKVYLMVFIISIICNTSLGDMGSAPFQVID